LTRFVFWSHELHLYTYCFRWSMEFVTSIYFNGRYSTVILEIPNHLDNNQLPISEKWVSVPCILVIRCNYRWNVHGCLLAHVGFSGSLFVWSSSSPGQKWNSCFVQVHARIQYLDTSSVL
jgi:hypothetical protein